MRTAFIKYVFLILICVSSLFYVSFFDVTTISNDAAQYIVTAKNILKGNGLSTNLLYYEEQQQNGLNTPQCGWPPGYPGALAILLFMGVPGTHVAVAAAAIFQALTYLIIYLILGLFAKKTSSGIIAALAWMAFALSHLYVLMGLSESAYVFAVLGSLYYITMGFRDERLARGCILKGSFFATLGFLFRYAGIAYVFAALSFLVINGIFTRNRERIKNGLLFGIMPTITAALLFLRNYYHVGNIFGGPRVENESLGWELFRAVWYTVKNLLGYHGNDIVSRLGIFFLIAGLLISLNLIIYAFAVGQIKRKLTPPSFHSNYLYRGRDREGKEASFVALGSIAGLYFLFNTAMIMSAALSTSASAFNARYMIPIVPFIMVFVAAGYEVLKMNGGELRIRIFKISLFIAFFFFIGGQVLSAHGLKILLETEIKHELVFRALMSERKGVSLKSFLENNLYDSESIIDSDGGQFLGFLIDRNSVGLPPPIYTRKIWDSTEVKTIANRLNVKYIVFHKRLFNPFLKKNINQDLMKEIAGGNVPGWLFCVYENDYSNVYEIINKKRKI